MWRTLVMLMMVSVIVFLPRQVVDAQFGYNTPIVSITSATITTTSAAALTTPTGAVNSYTGPVHFGTIVGGIFTSEGCETCSLTPNSFTGTTWIVYGIKPTAGAWAVSPFMPGSLPGRVNRPRMPDHWLSWQRWGVEYAAQSGHLVNP